MERGGFEREDISGKAGSLFEILEDLPGTDNHFMAPKDDGVQRTHTTLLSCFR